MQSTKRSLTNFQFPIPHLLVLLAYLLLTLVMTWPLAANFTTAIPGDGFDGWQNYWNLWWVKVALVERGQTPFVTDLLYHPTGVDLYFHTLNPFNGLVTLPIQLASGLIVAYNSVVLISWVLGGYGVYLLARWTVERKIEDSRLSTGNRSNSPANAASRSRDGVPNLQSPIFTHSAAFLAGVIFTFSPFHMAHLLGHLQVMALQWIPFYALYLLRALDQQRGGRSWLRSALMAGLFLIFAGLCDWYFVLYLFLFTGLVILWQVAGSTWRAARRDSAPAPRLLRSLAPLLPGATAGLLFLLVLAPILLPMVRAATQFSFMVRPSSDLYILSATVADFVIPNRLHTLFRPESFTWLGNQIAPVSERTIAIGYVPLLLVAVALWRDRSTGWRRTALWAAVAAFFFLMALGPRLNAVAITQADIPASPPASLASWTPFAVLNELIPFMRISRSVSRYALMVQLAVAVLAGIGLAKISTQRRKGAKGNRGGFSSGLVNSPRLSAFICGSILLLVLAEFWVAPFPMSPPDAPSFYTEVRGAAAPNGATGVLNLPMNFDRPGYLLYQTVHQQPLTVAYISRDDPRTLTERAPVLQHFRHLGPDIVETNPATVGQTVLNDLSVGWVVLDRYKMPGGLEREYTESLAGEIFTGRAPIFEDDRLTVYAVQLVDEPEPYVLLGELNWGPLTTLDDGAQARAITEAPAQLLVRHVPAEAALRIRYRSAEALLVERGGEILRSPAAPGGNEALIALEGAETITLHGESEAWIEAVELLMQ